VDKEWSDQRYKRYKGSGEAGRLEIDGAAIEIAYR
jgi:hypothetical protein